MRIEIVTPAPPRSRKGNRITAIRWARILRSLGHTVRVAKAYRDPWCDLLVAMHASKSAESIMRYRRKHPAGPLIVALTGTDLYRDLKRFPQASKALRAADRLVGLHDLVADALPQSARPKLRVILQSALPVLPKSAPRSDAVEVCVIGHLRAVKDPFRAAMALRFLPRSSRIRILHVGGALSASMSARARREAERDPRYRWLGELPRHRTLRILARSRAMILTSKMEGGANVISEAIVNRVPILASRIDGSVGLLGANYSGYFEVGDTRGLADLLEHIEADRKFYRSLRTQIISLVDRFNPQREQNSWKRLLGEVRSTVNR